MSLSLPKVDAFTTTTAIRRGEVSATSVLNATLAQIDQKNSALNCFTTITTQSAQIQSARLDKAIEESAPIGSLAGVPFGVKNLFDISGVTTLAGSRINEENPPAKADASAVARLKQAGAVLVGALNMDESANGFVTKNKHYGTTPNPHDLTRVCEGSAAAVASGLVTFALGTDTNGSVRVNAALSGIYGFKPTYGRISRAGTILFTSSLDHVGILARSVRDIATTYDFLQGDDYCDPAVSNLPPEPTVPQVNLGIEDLRIAVAEGYFSQGAESEALAVVEIIAQALNEERRMNRGLGRVILPESERARAAADIITAAESANLQLRVLRSRSQDFDPLNRDRLLAGALIPGNWFIQAQRFRHWYRDRVREVFQNVDIILAPTIPTVAPKLTTKTMVIAGEEVPVRANLGRFTQPLSLIGLPVLSVPIHRPNQLPLGVQIIAAPYDEALILRVARYLEQRNLICAPIASLPENH